MSKLGVVAKQEEGGNVQVLQRPGFGQGGVKVNLMANFFPMKVQPRAIFEYDIEVTKLDFEGNPIKGKKIDRDDMRILFDEFRKQNKETLPRLDRIVYDGARRVFSLEQLLGSGNTEATFRLQNVKTSMDNRGSQHEIKVIHCGSFSMDLSSAISMKDHQASTMPVQVLEMVLKQAYLDTDNKNYYPFRNGIYTIPGHGGKPPLDLGRGLQLWWGLSTTIRLSSTGGQGWRPLLCANSSNTVMYKKQSVIAFLSETVQQERGGGSFGGGGRGGFRGRGGGDRGGRGGGGFGGRGVRGGPQSHQQQLWEQGRQPRGREQGPEAPKSLNRNEALLFESLIKGRKVYVTHLKNQRSYKVRKVTELPASQLMFTMTDGDTERELSVAEYFSQKRQMPLIYPDLPCLESGTKSRPTFLPFEVCELHDQQKYTRKLGDDMVAAVIRKTAIPAPERAAEINNSMKELYLSQSKYMAAFGVAVDPNMVHFQGRMLAPPAIANGANRNTDPRPGDGAWRSEREAYLKPCTLNNICVLNMTRNKLSNDFRQFYFALVESLKRKGTIVSQGASSGPFLMVDNKKLPAVFDAAQVEEIQPRLMQFAKADLVIVLLMGKSPLYGDVKRIAETELGITTQCVQERNLSSKRGGPDNQTVDNIALKINQKKQGVNWGLANKNEPVIQRFMTCTTPEQNFVMYLGVDVTHPTRTEVIPSIAAIVGSLNIVGNGPTVYGCSMKVQRAINNSKEEEYKRIKAEHLVNMRQQAKERLLKFYQAQPKFGNGKGKPDMIIVFRDGISEGEFRYVLAEELFSIRAACRELGEDYKPGITFVVVQKRHQARLFVANQQDGRGKSGNVPAGTTVDTTITHPYYFDYYLCSHAGIQGTSRPSHYTVIHDDNGFKPDELQTITYNLCHLYERCTRSVSIPAPVYYADLVCNRARSYLRSIIGGSMSGSRMGEEDRFSDTQLEEFQRRVTVSDQLDPMFFI